ncbi:MAG TPA: hypothetical protein VFT22_40355 [Kofleriaceae bacterium]|nr:hypothetical protein [Kofleriaceae bacterium]
MKKSSNHKPRLVLKRDIIRTLATTELILVGGGGGDSEQSASALSACPACADPFM